MNNLLDEVINLETEIRTKTLEMEDKMAQSRTDYCMVCEVNILSKLADKLHTIILEHKDK